MSFTESLENVPFYAYKCLIEEILFKYLWEICCYDLKKKKKIFWIIALAKIDFLFKKSSQIENAISKQISNPEISGLRLWEYFQYHYA